MRPIHTDAEVKTMLAAIGLSSLEDLFSDIPESVKIKGDLRVPEAMSEGELRRQFLTWSRKNVTLEHQTSFLGAGVYRHDIPAVVKALISRGEFATAYTPYQAEASQGTLQAIYEFQTLICRLMGMDVANASHYDGATSLAESALMALDITKNEHVLMSRAVHPHYRQVAQTYLHGRGISFEEIGLERGTTSLAQMEKLLSEEKCAGVLIQYPNFFGCLEPLETIAELCRKYGALLVVAVLEPLALGLLKPPGERGASIVAGEGQSLGIAPSFGGPHVGFIATKQEFMRRIPGRLVGQSLDKKGNRAYTLTLQAREQHIRREKAASNVCTNQSLCAVANLIYLSVLGKAGVQEISEQCYHKAHFALKEWTRAGLFKPLWETPFFHEFAVQLPIPVASFMEQMEKEKVLAGYPLEKDYPEFPNGLLLTLTELNTRNEIEEFSRKAKRVLDSKTMVCV